MLVMGGIALALVCLVLCIYGTTSSVMAIDEPSEAGTGRRGPLPPPDWVVELMNDDTPHQDPDMIVKLATTSESSPSMNDSVVFNGETITYTVVVTNNVGALINDIFIVDVLPQNTLDNGSIRCLESSIPCEKINREEELREPLGGTIIVTVTDQIGWYIASLDPGESVQVGFEGMVTGQQEGANFSNQAWLQYKLESGEEQSKESNPTQTTVHVRPLEKGRASLSAAPTWISKDLGGTLYQDWGDFDRDGDLDLVLGSSVGTTVYRNEQGLLTEFWYDERLSYGVRWVDFVDDDALELVTVGASLGNTAWTSGTNYIYSYDQVAGQFQELVVFASDYQYLRVVPGDYNSDGNIELIASSNAINPPCPVNFYTTTNGIVVTGSIACINTNAAANIVPGDIDNDDDQDLVLGLFPNTTQVLINIQETFTNGIPFTMANSILVDSSTMFFPYDFAWGDYDGDGYLDLAAAFPLEKQVRIYHNQMGNGFEYSTQLPTNVFFTPLSVEWGDFTGDGHLDLAVADSPPRVYEYRNGEFSEIMSLPEDVIYGRNWSVRGIDYDNDGDLDLGLSDQHGPSMLFTAFAPVLSPTLTAVYSAPASSVAWGDANSDGALDLLFGAGPSKFGSRLYYNLNGAFPNSNDYDLFEGFGPHSVAFGDADGDHDLDIVLGVKGRNKVHFTGIGVPEPWSSSEESSTNSIAWGDADDDGDLDLLVGNNGQEALYVNVNLPLLFDGEPSWMSNVEDDTYSVVWGDYNNDRYLDFAVGNYGQPNRLYCNNGDNTFTLVWSSPQISATTSLAWADYDGDGDLDLAVGNDGEHNLIHENQTCQTQVCGKLPFSRQTCQFPDDALSDAPVWKSDELSQTTSLAWGDWDNDGDLDLAVGNEGQPDQVYENLDSAPGAPQLTWLWTSDEVYETTAVAWGDLEGDGDLDLAISQKGEGRNGFYENHYVSPSHLDDYFASTMPLPNNPSYLAIERPGSTDGAYLFSSAELLGSWDYPTVTIQYKLFDPDGTRGEPGSDEEGDPVIEALYEFSLNGGGTWYPASGLSSPITTTRRLGQEAWFDWDVQQDQAIGDDARFRICIIPYYQSDSPQRASTCAISPPFRVRGLTCEWPSTPTIYVEPSDPEDFQPGEPIKFRGDVEAYPSNLTFIWDFGDGATGQGPETEHTYARFGIYTVKLTVEGKPCPVSKEVFATTTVGRGTSIYLPVGLKNSTTQQ